MGGIFSKPKVAAPPPDPEPAPMPNEQNEQIAARAAARKASQERASRGYQGAMTLASRTQSRMGDAYSRGKLGSAS